MTLIQDSMIGGGSVLRGFTKGTEWQAPGTPFTRAELLALPRANLQALVDTGKLTIYPATPVQMGGPGQLHLISRGFGKYDIIEGRIVNQEPYLSKEEAEAAFTQMQADAVDAPAPGEQPIDPVQEPETVVETPPN